MMPGTKELAPAERLTALFHQHGAQVRDFARRRVGPHAAEEILAETFLVAWRRIDDVPDPALAWLYKVASYEVANHRRRQERNQRLTVALAARTTDQGAEPEPGESLGMGGAVRDAFAILRPEDQEVLRLAAWEQLSSAEGAEVLGCSIAAYRVRLHRARRRLARRAGIGRAVSSTQPERAPSEANPQRGSAASPDHQDMEGTEAIG
jgi:RNA polymerase sigma-70 factor (ECF subfamily)